MLGSCTVSSITTCGCLMNNVCNQAQKENENVWLVYSRVDRTDEGKSRKKDSTLPITDVGHRGYTSKGTCAQKPILHQLIIMPALL